MKLKIFAAVTAASCLYATAAFAQGIPVIDVSSITQQIAQVTAWGKQYTQMLDQYRKMTDSVNAMTGGRGLGQVLNNDAYRQTLPADFIGQFDKLRSAGAAGATADAVAIYNSIKTFDCAKQFPGSQNNRLSCEASAMVVPTNIGLINKSIGASADRQKQLQGLMSQIDMTQDVKASQDLANRINTEIALLQNEKMMMDMALAQQERQAKLIEQQKKEAGLKRLTEPGTNPFVLR